MQKLEAYHEDERILFSELMTQRVPDKIKNLAKNSKDFEREQKIKEFAELRDNLTTGMFTFKC